MPKFKSGLSSQEAEILRNLALGKTWAQVAADLQISTHTLSTYLDRCFKYLGARNLMEAINLFQATAATAGPLPVEEVAAPLPLVSQPAPAAQPEMARVRILNGQLLLNLELALNIPLGNLSSIQVSGQVGADLDTFAHA